MNYLKVAFSHCGQMDSLSSRGLFLRGTVEASRDPGGNGVLGVYSIIILAFPPFLFLTLAFQSHLPNESHIPKTLPQALLSGNVY